MSVWKSVSVCNVQFLNREEGRREARKAKWTKNYFWLLMKLNLFLAVELATSWFSTGTRSPSREISPAELGRVRAVSRFVLLFSGCHANGTFEPAGRRFRGPCQTQLNVGEEKVSDFWNKRETVSNNSASCSGSKFLTTFLKGNENFICQWEMIKLGALLLQRDLSFEKR